MQANKKGLSNLFYFQPFMIGRRDICDETRRRSTTSLLANYLGCFCKFYLLRSLSYVISFNYYYYCSF